MHPTGGFAFDFPHDIREPVRGFQSHQQMDMIRHASHGKSDAIESANDAAEILMQFCPDAGSDPWFTMFCGKNEVVMQ
jgi:hypothetical protein